MDWLAQNWFWVVLGALFVWMMFGHSGGCCGGATSTAGTRLRVTTARTRRRRTITRHGASLTPGASYAANAPA
ncbi:MAG TPA: hypothetical protein VNA86_06655, partial [bacterium]|nr:hypothetical protein [bacterium]